jgi:hypothetical protein
VKEKCTSHHLVGRLGRRGRYRYRHDESSGLHGGVEALGDRPVAGAADVGVVPLPERRDALPPRPRLRPRLLTAHKSRRATHQKRTSRTLSAADDQEEGTGAWLVVQQE